MSQFPMLMQLKLHVGLVLWAERSWSRSLGQNDSKLVCMGIVLIFFLFYTYALTQLNSGLSPFFSNFTWLQVHAACVVSPVQLLQVLADIKRSTSFPARQSLRLSLLTAISYTPYERWSPELIPVSMQVSHKPSDKLPLVYFPQGPRLSSQPKSVTALWPIPNYTAWCHDFYNFSTDTKLRAVSVRQLSLCWYAFDSALHFTCMTF